MFTKTKTLRLFRYRTNQSIYNTYTILLQFCWLIIKKNRICRSIFIVPNFQPRAFEYFCAIANDTERWGKNLQLNFFSIS